MFQQKLSMIQQKQLELFQYLENCENHRATGEELMKKFGVGIAPPTELFGWAKWGTLLAEDQFGYCVKFENYDDFPPMNLVYFRCHDESIPILLREFARYQGKIEQAYIEAQIQEKEKRQRRTSTGKKADVWDDDQAFNVCMKVATGVLIVVAATLVAVVVLRALGVF